MSKSDTKLSNEFFLWITILIVLIELFYIVFGMFDGVFNYFKSAYVLIGLVGVAYGFKKSIIGKWLLWIFFGFQIVVIQTLDFKFGYEPTFSFPISYNSSSTTNGQYTKLFILNVNLVTIFLLIMTNRFYSAIHRDSVA